jgi:hypothetical protein
MKEKLIMVVGIGIIILAWVIAYDMEKALKGPVDKK